MIVVSDTTPVTSLLQVGQCELLARLALTARLEDIADFRVAAEVKEVIFRHAGE